MVHLARHDALTGLYNRSVLQEKLDQACKQAATDCSEFSLFFLDLDGFKKVNDTLGHATGDALLQAVAGRLRNCVRSTDVVCRLGGDEFVVILSAPIDEKNTTAIAKKMVEAISERFVIGSHTIQVSTSLGIARFPLHGQASGVLQSHADSAMYLAKREGKNRYHQYHPSDDLGPVVTPEPSIPPLSGE
jgi:diguanylate cyclase (GGDEF)-like protein